MSKIERFARVPCLRSFILVVSSHFISLKGVGTMGPSSPEENPFKAVRCLWTISKIESFARGHSSPLKVHLGGKRLFNES